jgi:LPS sulfotransferase NodH
MSEYYQNLDRSGGFEYDLYRISSLGLRYFRGPAIDMNRPFIAFVGSAHTFGRFVSQAFPTLLAKRLDIPAINLGVGGAGPRHFNTNAYVELLNRSEAVVVQVLSARSSSNSLFDNSRNGGMQGRSEFADHEIRAEEFFRRVADKYGVQRCKQLIRETREDYVLTFIDFLRKIAAPKILLWLSTREPDYVEDYEKVPYGVFGAFPQLVNSQMIAEISLYSDAFIKCTSRDGLPQKLWTSGQSIDGAVSTNGTLENRYYPSPAMHLATVDALESTCRRFLGKPAHEVPTEDYVRFIIVAAERTGSNLLVGMLNDYDGCFCGNELFNFVNLSKDIIPWHDIPGVDLSALLVERKNDPVVFWNRLWVSSVRKGYSTIGFKLMYSHVASQKVLVEYLVADRAIRVIHLTRRNQLRRLVSEHQARATNEWAARWGANVEARPAVAISTNDIVNSFQKIEAQQAMVDSVFANHAVLRLVYEDLVQRPFQVAERVARFLGLCSLAKPTRLQYQKTGAENISEALTDFDALRAKLRRWASFFDE